MNGAESLVRTLVDGGVELCFANPGTSEMHFVAALDSVSGMRCVLCLFEGVATGAADGYYRMARKPAASLLHVGSGLGNGLANLHNARKARSGIVNIVGNHAVYHQQHDTPLSADVEAVARPMSDWVRSATSSRTVAADAADAIAVACQPPGRIASLILPANTAWEAADGPAAPRSVQPRSTVSRELVRNVASILQANEGVTLLLGDAGLYARAKELAGRIAAKTGCSLLSEYQSAREERGVGRVAIARIPYSVDSAVAMLRETRHLILIGAKPPVAFFAYPEKPSVLTQPDCQLTTLANADEDIEQALYALAEELGALDTPPLQVATGPRPLPAKGPFTLEGIAQSLAAFIPDDAVVVDESVSSGRGFAPITQNAAPHDWLSPMGGSIGFGLPQAVGAAVAVPDRKVILLQADGSAMYTLSAMWTMAREQLNIVIVVFSNRGYKILLGELANVGGGKPGGNAMRMMTIDDPALDWQALARGFGMTSSRACNLDEFNRELALGIDHKGPHLIELVL
ncbi:acetolactate synthase large subunit [Hydrogenophaga sp. BPS33]|uniref:acetolactate synthase large subunit n=1 Tax=Hydrogenophaga sp. BPS33 TaxID=2651974 RepID=UPI00131FEA85|nr:acetolactate synthase large subunit [Hydrogenophaga sp. BPS33]QHE84674.1 acetolactate synthase large subunit [Hydrogenophaga sp. BPS33]